MAVTLDSTVAGAQANSYVSLEDAEAYFEGRLVSELWEQLTDDQKKKALITATRRIDREKFGGQITLYGVQSLQWPRTGVVSRDYINSRDVAPTFEPTGFYYVDANTIPDELKQATCEQAYFYLLQAADETTTVSDYDLEVLSSYAVGPLNATIKANVKADRLPTIVYQLLRAIGDNAIIGYSGLRFTD